MQNLHLYLRKVEHCPSFQHHGSCCLSGYLTAWYYVDRTGYHSTKYAVRQHNVKGRGCNACSRSDEGLGLDLALTDKGQAAEKYA